MRQGTSVLKLWIVVPHATPSVVGQGLHDNRGVEGSDSSARSPLRGGPKPQPRQVFLDGRVQLRGFGLLFPPLGGQALHLLFKRLAVLFLRFRPDVAAGGKNVTVLADLIQGGALAEAGNVGVGLSPLVLAFYL